MKYEELKNLINEHGAKHYDVETIEKAYRLAEKMHEGQYRKTGEAYVEHPVAVAGIVTELGLDTTSIVAALLHDVVEDTDITLEEIEKCRHICGNADGISMIAMLTMRPKMN